MSKLINFCIIAVAGIVGGLAVLVFGVIAWFAALGFGLSMILAGISWIGWHATHHLSSWHAMVKCLEFAAPCAVIVAIPAVLSGGTSPGPDRQVVEVSDAKRLSWLLLFWSLRH